MDFRTPIELQKADFMLNQNHKILLMGSCFAEEIGKCLKRDKFSCEQNPFGVLYNPYSISMALKKIFSGEDYGTQDLFQSGGLWHSWMHHSSFSHENQEACLLGINNRLHHAREFMKEARLLIITLGSNRCFRYRKLGEVVGNCHKVPEKEFEMEDLSAKDIYDLFSLRVISELKKNYPQLRLLFTVSPIRYLKYGMHESTLGKANLLMGVDMLQKQYGDIVSYFPAYEIMMDDLRDYRFYADDMVHPTTKAVEYIYKNFQEFCFDSLAKDFVEEWRGIEKALGHRPFNPSSDSYRKFIENTKNKIIRMQEKFPTIHINEELELCTTILNKLQK